MIEWNEKYELGIDIIDQQHKQLIKISNKLYELLTNATYGSDIYDDIVEVIDEIKEYTVYHFTTEENLLAKYGYFSLDDHILQHKDLISKIEDLNLTNLDEDQVIYGKKILNYLINWIFKHISGTDFLYKEFLKKHLNEQSQK